MAAESEQQALKKAALKLGELFETSLDNWLHLKQLYSMYAKNIILSLSCSLNLIYMSTDYAAGKVLLLPEPHRLHCQ